MDEILLVRVLTRLVRVHAEFGEDIYEEAVHQALVAIGRSVHCYAVASSKHRDQEHDNVVHLADARSAARMNRQIDPDEL